MNVLQTTPPQDLQLRSWRIGASSDAAELTLKEVSSVTMDASPKSRPQSATPASPTLTSVRPSTSPRNDSPQQTLSVARHVQRRGSATPRKPSLNTDALSSTSSPAVDGQTDGENSPWVGAVGRASLGKSGRVIERLMADIDRLKRELNAEISHRQEIERREDLNRGTIDGLKAENENLQQAKEIDASVLKRRDRKIEDLKIDLDIEREARNKAEQNAKEVSEERDEIITRSRRDVAEAKDVAQHATRHAEVLEQSHKQLSAEYRQRAEVFSRDLQKLVEARDDEARKVKNLDSVMEQLRHETDRSARINTSLNETFESYFETTETRITHMQEIAKRREAANAIVTEEAERVVGEARWLINIGKSAAKKSGIGQSETG